MIEPFSLRKEKASQARASLLLCSISNEMLAMGKKNIIKGGSLAFA